MENESARATILKITGLQDFQKLSANNRPNCERSNASIFTIRVLDAVLILLRPFTSNFIFGAEANISARAEIRHVIR